MSTPSAAPAPGPSDLTIVEPLCAIFRRAIKASGQKYTPERAQILDLIVRKEGLFEAEELIDKLRGGSFRVSKATVYRTIKLLVDAGIIRRVLVSKEQAHYQLVYGTAPNDLLVIVDEGEVIAIDVPELAAIRDRICREHGLTAQGHNLQIFAVRKSKVK